MPREISDEVKKRAIAALKYMKEVVPCVTIAKIANALNVSWSAARHVLKQLVRNGLVVEITVGGKMLWCLSEDAAAHEIYELRRAVWLVLCRYRHRFVSPTTVAKLIAEDQYARKVFARYVDIDNRNADTLRFVAAVLKDMTGGPIDRRPHKTTYYIPGNVCEREPRLEDVVVTRYKSPYRLVSIKLTKRLYQDLIAAVNHLGISAPEIIRMAIARLLSQYKHLLDKHKSIDLEAE